MAIVGGGDSACQAALFLSRTCTTAQDKHGCLLTGTDLPAIQLEDQNLSPLYLEGSPAGVGSPGCRPETGGGQDPADRAGAQPVAQPGEFALQAAMAPRGVLLAMRSTSARIIWDRWSTRLVGVGPLRGVRRGARPAMWLGRRADGPAAGGGVAGSELRGSRGLASRVAVA